MKVCQKQMIKSVRVENDPFIGYCKVYECKVVGVCFPCLFDVTQDDFLKDQCGRCRKDLLILR
jgi:hypothetical protein